jgi:titin
VTRRPRLGSGFEALESREVPSVTALGDAYSVHQGQTLDVLNPGVLANDSSSDGATLTASLVSGVSHGTLTLLSGGRVQYRPTAGYVGSDSFIYQASDGHGGSAEATVSLTVTDTAPVAQSDWYAVAVNDSLRVSAPGLLGNDSDADGDHLNAVLVSGPSHGRLWLTYNGSFVYTPNTNYVGSDSFRYQATDGALTSNPATVTINVDTPTILSFAVNTTADTKFDHAIVDDAGNVVNVVDANGQTSLRAAIEYANDNPLNGDWNTNHYNIDLSGSNRSRVYVAVGMSAGGALLFRTA